jgi:lipoprotein-anchoring transpeptidase ErfK/SrfK
MSRHRDSAPPSARLRATLAAIAAGLAAGAAGGLLVAPAQAAISVPASQTLAGLQNDHAARATPSAAGRLLETVAVRRPLTGVRTVLPVIGRRRAADGSTWLRVRLPGRPLGHTGWIAASNTRRDSTEWHIVIRLAARQVVVYRDGLVDRRFSAVVGKSSTPTPRGRFFVEEAVALARSDAGAPFALASSARSQVLQQFEGGPGQIALHGTGNLSSPLGTAASHGCVRISPRAISWLASRIGGGVPMTIVS